MNARAYDICTSALRDNWGPGEISPAEAVEIMFTALDEEHDTSVSRTKLAREEATVMAAMVFADLPDGVDFGALASNVLRAIDRLPFARRDVKLVEAMLLGFDTCLRRPPHGGLPTPTFTC